MEWTRRAGASSRGCRPSPAVLVLLGLWDPLADLAVMHLAPRDPLVLGGRGSPRSLVGPVIPLGGPCRPVGPRVSVALAGRVPLAVLLQVAVGPLVLPGRVARVPPRVRRVVEGRIPGGVAAALGADALLLPALAAAAPVLRALRPCLWMRLLRRLGGRPSSLLERQILWLRLLRRFGGKPVLLLECQILCLGPALGIEEDAERHTVADLEGLFLQSVKEHPLRELSAELGALDEPKAALWMVCIEFARETPVGHTWKFQRCHGRKHLRGLSAS
mmetsp:Transcript_22073/g.50430  ORF Transcript_22073/g.50430 Transcript_22073/m.50430 type:complete len:274 (-) Transcript_22073:356-1177(-)